MGAPALTIDITGRADKFQKSLHDVGQKADSTVAGIESKFAAFDPQLNTDAYIKSLEGMVGVAAQFASKIGGTGLLFGAAAASVGALIELTVHLNQSLSDSADMADRVGISFRKLQEDKFAANSLGVSDTSFNTSLEGFAKNLQDAKFNANDLVRVFQANGVAIKNANGELKSTTDLLQKAYSIVQRQGSVQDAIQVGGFLGFDKQFSQAIQDAGSDFQGLAKKAREVGAVVDDATIKKAREFTAQWNIASTAWSAGMRSAINNILPLLNTAVQGAISVINSIASVYSFIQGIKNLVIHPRLDEQSIGELKKYLASLELLRVSKMDDRMGATVPIDVNTALDGARIPRPDKHRVANADEIDAEIAKVKQLIKLKDEALDRGPTRLVINGPIGSNPGPAKAAVQASSFDNEGNRIARHTAIVQADTAALYLNNAAQATFRAEFELLTAAAKDNPKITQDQIDKYEKLRPSMTALEALQASGIKLTDDQTASLIKWSKGSGDATAGNDKVKLSLTQLNSASQQLGSALSSAFTDAVIEGKNLNDVVNGLLKTLEKSALNSVFASIFNAPASGGVSPFLSIFGIGKNAEGTDNWQGGPTWVGEKGPEILNVPRGAQIVPNSVATRAGGANSFNLTVSLAGANGDDAIRQIAGQASAHGAAQVLAKVPGMAVQAVNDHMRRYG